MPSLKFKDSRIIRSEFVDTGKIPNNEDGIAVKMSLMPKLPDNIDIGKRIVVKLKTEFGNKEQYIYILQEILCAFEITDCEKDCNLTDEFLRKHCFPTVLNEGKNFFDATTKIYGYPDIELPLWDLEDMPLNKSSE